MSAPTGVFPVYENAFHVGDSAEDCAFPKDLTTFSVSFGNNVDSWSPLDQGGFYNHLITGKEITITLSGKRNVGDTGNDYIAGKAFKLGKDADGYFDWTFPDGTKVSWESATYDVKNVFGGDSTNTGPLECDVKPNGKPTIKPTIKPPAAA